MPYTVQHHPLPCVRCGRTFASGLCSCRDAGPLHDLHSGALWRSSLRHRPVDRVHKQRHLSGYPTARQRWSQRRSRTVGPPLTCHDRINVVSGSIDPIATETTIGAVFTYDNMQVGKLREADYIARKVEDYNKDEPGQGDAVGRMTGRSALSPNSSNCLTNTWSTTAETAESH